MGCSRSSGTSSGDDITDQCAVRLQEMEPDTARAMIETVPTEWDVSKEAREAWAELIYRRAGFVADNIQAMDRADRPRSSGSMGE